MATSPEAPPGADGVAEVRPTPTTGLEATTDEVKSGDVEHWAGVLYDAPNAHEVCFAIEVLEFAFRPLPFFRRMVSHPY